MSPRRAVPQQKKRSRFPSWLLIVGTVVVIVIALVAGAAWIIKSENPIPGTTGNRTIGDAKAPTTFVEFSDFQ